MAGTVEHMSLSEARSAIRSSQARLSSFGTNGTTYVGIVNTENDDFRDVVDEMEPDLSPPNTLFYQWLAMRDKLEDEENMDHVRAHNEALNRVNYRDRFGTYLGADPDAQRALDRLVDRVVDGEHIVLVCYCNDEQWCHRQPVTETIKSMVDERLDTDE